MKLKRIPDKKGKECVLVNKLVRKTTTTKVRKKEDVKGKKLKATAMN